MNRPTPLDIIEDREFITDPIAELLAIQLYLVSPLCTRAAGGGWPAEYAHMCSPDRRPWTHISRLERELFRAKARGKEPLT